MAKQWANMNGAQALIRTLEDAGVEHIFGYPGGAIMPVYDALLDSDLKHVLCRHEQGAALAADGYARASGRLGVCMATSGPGATNLVTGIANAFLDSVPMLAITGQVPSNLMGTDAFQEVDIFGMTMPVVKHSFILRDANAIQSTLQEAMHIAQDGRPGPVLVDLPKDVALAKAAYSKDYQPHFASSVYKQSLDAGQLQQAMALIASASKPLIYVGGGAAIAGCKQAVRTLANRLQIPVVSTLKGLGVMPSTAPEFLGMLGMHGNQAANYAVQECDVLICIGARFDDRATGKLDGFAPNATVIHLDADPAEVSKLRQADVGLVGDMAEALDALAESRPPRSSAWSRRCRQQRETFQPRYDYPGKDIYAPGLLRSLSEFFDGDVCISCDVGQHQMWVAQHCLFDDPSNHLTSGGLGTMGYGIPAGLGAQLAQPEHTVVVVSGDGSIMMNLQELATLQRYRLPVKIVLLDNASLGMVRQWQELFFDRRFSEIDLSDNPDFVHLAQGFGLPAMAIESASDIQAGLAFLRDTPGACLLHVKIDPKANVWPLVPPGKTNEVMMEQTP